MTDSFARMRQLHGTTSEWAANDIVIGLGELALEKTAGGAYRMKVGDGATAFSALPYFDGGIFSYVLKGGDTMTGALVVPGLTVNGTANVTNGLVVTAGNSSFGGPVTLGANATATNPATVADDSQRVATTHWVQQQVGGIITGLELKGTWNAATNTPPLASGGAGVPTPQRGDFYLVSVSGTTTLDGISTWNAGDSVVFNGSTWQRVPQTLFPAQITAALGYTPANEANVINRQIVDAEGDLIVGSAADTVVRLARGTTGQVLQATASGIQWAVPATWRQIGRVVPAAGAPSVIFQPVPTDVNSLIFDFDVSPQTNAVDFFFQMYDNTGTLDQTTLHYTWGSTTTVHSAAIGASPVVSTSGGSTFSIGIVFNYYAATRRVSTSGGIRGRGFIANIKDARSKFLEWSCQYPSDDGTQWVSTIGNGSRATATAITGFRLVWSAGNFAAGGAVNVWGCP